MKIKRKGHIRAANQSQELAHLVKRLPALTLFFSIALPACAHRLDEYLQATLISLQEDRMHASMRLVPGVAVSPIVLGIIDSNRDGVISEAEGHAYAQKVLADLSLSLNGHPLTPRLVSVHFPAVQQIKQGLGEIQIEFTADLSNAAINRKLVIRNHHLNNLSAYLVNCLAINDRDIQVVAQNRNETQSFYELNYLRTVGNLNQPSSTWWPGVRPSLGAARGLQSMFCLGMRHIAEGTDHLLFLLALLLPAPLLVSGSRWTGFAGLRHSLSQILKVVTAFTVGHSITLALAGLGLVLVPSRPIEVLIAVSILVSSIHALRPIFPGREAAVAAFFGLIHGLAFAATLGQLGLERWLQLANIFAFNLGIEAMQLIVVAATMPALVLLSRTRVHSFVRVAGAIFAGIASMGWIAERLLNLNIPVDLAVAKLAQGAVWIALASFFASLLWILQVHTVTVAPTASTAAPTTSEL